MESLLEYLKKFGTLPLQDIELLRRYVRQKNLSVYGLWRAQHCVKSPTILALHRSRLAESVKK